LRPASRPWIVGGLLFGSGACALVYQIAWTREFRLIFGHSTAASAAVLAIFIGGLGLGGLLIGPRADRHPRPLALYARLEALAALSAALTPGLLWLVREIYVGLGGTGALGAFAGTLLRLALSALVLGVPTVMMGGTLPAAARDVEESDDARRRSTALLYGLNTLGAVTGCLIATFVALEALGNRRTLWAACLVNLAVAALASRLSRPRRIGGEATTRAESAAAPTSLVLGAAMAVGFAFFLMELVWYRMLAPLLGGTVFTFGLILAVALLGIGCGGAAYAAWGSERPASLRGFALTCLLEAAAVALPYALGDRIALLALLLRPLGQAGFGGHVLAWTEITGIVVFPAAFVAGAQFPLLIALLGRGERDVGRQIGLAYAWNTLGSILGSLAGGFGLLPALTAPGCWRLVAALLAALGLAAAMVDARRTSRGAALLGPAALALAVGLMLAAVGPTAAWRHSGIGAGRFYPSEEWLPNRIESEFRDLRRAIVWERDGVESSVGIHGIGSIAFVVNGKVDGNSREDAPTQVMAGILGALVHPGPKRALVVGLGTGSTAGWLADVPGVERVDVVELEPAILEMARRCASVNRNALSNPRLHVRFGDAREVLLTTRDRYDLIVSEPSNPYRAGVASLYTREYYRAAASRLNPGGLFLQWTQGYEVDAATVRAVYATIASELPSIESWQTHASDLLLMASARPVAFDYDRLRERMGQEPYRSALLDAWRVTSLEGLLARYVGGPALARRLAAEVPEAGRNTDDRNILEFGYARTLGQTGLFDFPSLREAAASLKAERPERTGGGPVDLLRIEDELLAAYSGTNNAPPARQYLSLAQGFRATAHTRWIERNRAGALAAWRAQPEEPRNPTELAMVAELLADAGDESALDPIAKLRALQPAEADACLARLRIRQNRYQEALDAAEAAIRRYRTDPWPAAHVMQGALDVALELAAQRSEMGPRIEAALRDELALRALNEIRTEILFLIASREPVGQGCAAFLQPFEPNIPWSREWLTFRQRCYSLTGDPRAGLADRELRRFLAAEPAPLLPPQDPHAAAGA
jgi:predicted membrane-bound spermidine synthase